MRIDSNTFSEKNKSKHKTPRWVIRIDFSNNGTDFRHFTSHAGITGITGTIFEKSIIDVSSVSTKLSPSQGISTVGNLTFSLLDKNEAITDLLRTKLDAGFGIRNKQAAVFFGYEGLNFSDFITIQTQIISDDVVLDNDTVIFSCSDVNRNLKDDIFVLNKSTLARSIDDSQTFLYSYASDWENCTHGASYSDAPNEEVFYIRVEDEMVRVTNSVADNTLGEPLFKLTIVRGVLGSVPAFHTFDETSTQNDKRPELKEIVYLELPMIKLVYAILSGSLYNQGGSTFPSNWTINLSGSLIRLTDFLNIGADWWNGADDGKVQRYIGEEQQEAKTFIESQCLLPYGAYSKIYGDGTLGISKSNEVGSNTMPSFVLDADNIISISPLTNDLSATVNDILINWNKDILLDQFTRGTAFIDATSKSIHGDARQKTFNFRGLHGSRDTVSVLKRNFDSYRDRFANPPLRLTVDIQPSYNDVEVGDIVWVDAQTKDYTNGGAQTTLNRAFEVQALKTSMKTGVVSLTLFGSSGKAGVVQNLDGASVLTDGYYNSEGTDLASLAETTLVGGVLQIDTDLNLTGNTNMLNSGAIYYSTQNLQLNSGVTLTINLNTQIRFKGHFQINGVVDGDERGIVGGIGTTNLEPTPTTGGVYGVSESGGGISEHDLVVGNRGNSKSVKGVTSIPSIAGDGVPLLDIEFNGTSIKNLPSNLMGVPGSAGAGANAGPGFPDTGDKVAVGGDGATSGAGLLMIGRGCSFGASGAIHLNGGTGLVGGKLFTADLFATNFGSAGYGGGACGGACYYLNDGSANPTPNMFSKFSSIRGATPRLAGATFYHLRQPEKHTYTLLPVGFQTTFSFYKGHGNSVDYGTSMYRIMNIPTTYIAESDSTAFAPAVQSLTLTEFVNTPRSQKGNLSSIQVVVGEPSSNAYSHASIFYREVGTKDFYEVGTADDSTAFVVPSDGLTYEVLAKSVSYSGLTTNGGKSAQITVTDIEKPLQTVPDLQVPNVTGLEIFGQGNNTVFEGKEVKIEWRTTSLNEWYNAGFEPPAFGAGAGGIDLFTRDWEVRVYNPTTGDLLRTEYVTDNFYFYSHEKNFEDTGGSPVRSLRFEVRQRSRQNSFSLVPAVLPVSNTPPILPTPVTVGTSTKSIKLEFPRPTDTDWVGCKVYMSTTSPVTINDANLVFEDAASTIFIQGLDANVKYYYHFLLYDEFGDGTLSSEYNTTTAGVLNADLDSTPPTDPTSLVLTTGTEADAVYATGWIKLTWTASTDDGQFAYKIIYWTASDASKQEVQIVSGVEEYKFVNLVQTEQYFFEVIAEDWAGNRSGTLSGNKVCAGTAAAALDQIATDLGAGIIAGTVTGATIRTAASGSRVQLDSTNGIQAFDGGSQRLKIGIDGSGWLADASKLFWNTSGDLTVANIKATSGTIGGFVIENSLLRDTASNLVLDSANKKISLGSTVFGNAGIQLDAGSGTSMYVGDGNSNFLKYAGNAIEIGRDTNLRGVSHYGKTGIFERFSWFRATDNSGSSNSSQLYLTKINANMGFANWHNESSGLKGAFYLSNSSSLSSGIRIERRAAPTELLSGKFNAFRSIKTRFMYTGFMTNMNAEFYTGNAPNGFGFEMTAGVVKVWSQKTGQTKYLSGTVATMSLGTPMTFEAIYDPTTPSVKFYINNSLVNTVTTSSQIPNSIDAVDRWWAISNYTTGSPNLNSYLNFSFVEFMNEV